MNRNPTMAPPPLARRAAPPQPQIDRAPLGLTLEPSAVAAVGAEGERTITLAEAAVPAVKQAAPATWPIAVHPAARSAPLADARSSMGKLAPADFHRLGVRALEARPRVIRKSAYRLARPLVRQYLAERSPQVETDLVQVVRSTYRLLDPRNRGSQLERVLLAQTEAVPKVPRLWTHPDAGPGPTSGSSQQRTPHPGLPQQTGKPPSQVERPMADADGKRLATTAALSVGAAMWLAMRIRAALTQRG